MSPEVHQIVLAVKELLPELSKVGAGTGILVIVGIMAWKNSWPWSGRK